MSILEKEVWVKCGLRTDKHYESKGYVIPKNKNNSGRLTTTKGTKILVRIEDLPINSNAKITKICDADNCGKYIFNQRYVQVLNRRTDGNDYCDVCSKIKGGITRKNNTHYEKSLEFFALQNNKNYLLTEFGDKNKNKPIKISFGTNEEFIWKCFVCTSEYLMKLSDRTISGYNCPYCSGQRVNHTNCLWATHPEVAELLRNKEDGYKCTKGSHQQLDFICPQCGNSENKTLSNVVRQGFSCSICGDNISYPEKFMMNVLKQININFETQKIFEWSKEVKYSNTKLSGRKRYDFYIPSLNMIIETHGGQHYTEGYQSISGKTLEEEQENDKIKENLAKKNGIEHYIIIDCSFSELEFIKNSILKSKFLENFNLNEIDWLKCHEFACSSLVKIVCDLWTKESIQNVSNIAEILKISKDTVVRYLKQGVKIGWCDYDPKEVMKKVYEDHKIRNKERKSIKIVQLTLDGDYIKTWDSATVASKELMISQGNITSACIGNYKYAGGFKWKYKADYENIITNQHNAI